MPVENLEEEGLPKNPNLELAAWRFTITNPDGKDKEEAKKRLLDAIKENGVCSLFHFVLSHKLMLPRMLDCIKYFINYSVFLRQICLCLTELKMIQPSTCRLKFEG